jgi:hypothetical protein
MVFEYRSVRTSFRCSTPERDLAQWTSVFGKKANVGAPATAGFKQAIANLGKVGFAFGGGCFFGHGVRVSGGSAKFAVTSYVVK